MKAFESIHFNEEADMESEVLWEDPDVDASDCSDGCCDTDGDGCRDDGCC